MTKYFQNIYETIRKKDRYSERAVEKELVQITRLAMSKRVKSSISIFILFIFQHSFKRVS